MLGPLNSILTGISLGPTGNEPPGTNRRYNQVYWAERKDVLCPKSAATSTFVCVLVESEISTSAVA